MNTMSTTGKKHDANAHVKVKYHLSLTVSTYWVLAKELISILTNQQQFSTGLWSIDHKWTSQNIQYSSGTTSRRRVLSRPLHLA